MKKLILTISTFLLSQALSAQTIIENFNYPVGALSASSASDWLDFSSLGTCIPEIDVTGRVTSKIQCSSGTHLAYKPWAFDFTENDTIKIAFTTSLNGNAASFSKAYLEILSTSTNQNVAFGASTSGGSYYTSIYGTKNATSFSQSGNSLNPSAANLIMAEIIWKKDPITNTYGELTLYLVDYGAKDQSLKKDQTIQSYKLPFTSLDGFQNIYLTISGSGATLRPIIQSIMFDQKEGLVTANEDLINKKNLSFFPNPTSDIIHLSESKNWTLFDAMGNNLITGSGDTINLIEFKSGSYFIKIEDQNESKIQRIIKQ